jgi:alpha-tubulin suppressor-like RCC1 family protein
MVDRVKRFVSATLLVALMGAAGAATSVLAGTGSSGETGASLQAWGDNAYGQIGHGIRTEAPVRSPLPVGELSCATAAAVSFANSYAVLGDGHVAAWGADSAIGGLGDGGAAGEYSHTPVEVPGITDAMQVAADIPNTFVLLANGTIEGWGQNTDGEYGTGSASVGGDTPVAGIGGLASGVSAVATANAAVLALLTSGEVQSWGFNEDDQLGRETVGSEPEPGRVVNATKSGSLKGIKAIALSSTFGLGLTTSGEVVAWGGNAFTGLGAGNVKYHSVAPVNVEDVAGDGKPLTHVVAIAAGAEFALALLEDGQVVGWGKDQLGQLGNGETSSASFFHPVLVEGLSEVEEIAATQENGYARLANGTVWAWGNNTQGEVGNGSETTPIDKPAQVAGLAAATSALADGADGQSELALGPPSECGAGSGSHTGTGEETTGTSSNPGGGTTSTATTATSTITTTTTGPTTPTSVVAAKAATNLALQCGKRELALTDVVESNGRVLLDGVAAASLAGETVKILFDDRQQVASAKVGAQGQFSTSAPLPPAKLRGGNSARYTAEAGGLKSLELKLTRRLILDPPVSAAGKVTLTGQVLPPLGKPLPVIDVEQQLTCGGGARLVAQLKPIASGRFIARVAAPAGARAALYRLSTKVRESTSSRKLFATASLPEAAGIP